MFMYVCYIGYKNILWGQLSYGVVVLRGQLFRGLLSGGSCPGFSCPGGSCPRTGIFVVELLCVPKI